MGSAFKGKSIETISTQKIRALVCLTRSPPMTCIAVMTPDFGVPVLFHQNGPKILKSGLKPPTHLKEGFTRIPKLGLKLP